MQRLSHWLGLIAPPRRYRLVIAVNLSAASLYPAEQEGQLHWVALSGIFTLHPQSRFILLVKLLLALAPLMVAAPYPVAE
jgi:hypothetical protein